MAPRGKLRGRCGGFLGQVPYSAAHVSKSITARLCGGRLM